MRTDKYYNIIALVGSFEIVVNNLSKSDCCCSMLFACLRRGGLVSSAFFWFSHGDFKQFTNESESAGSKSQQQRSHMKCRARKPSARIQTGELQIQINYPFLCIKPAAGMVPNFSNPEFQQSSFPFPFGRT